MANPINRIGEFSEQGRGLPVSLTRPGGALPFSPLVRQAYAGQPRARLGWGQGVVACGDCGLDAPWSVSPDDTPLVVASMLRRDDSGFVPVLHAGRFVGVIYSDALLQCVADNRIPPTVARLISTQIPTCAPSSALVDAVRQMFACYIRRIPVIGDAAELVGLLSLSAAIAVADRDPAVRDVLEAMAVSPSLFANAWR